MIRQLIKYHRIGFGWFGAFLKLSLYPIDFFKRILPVSGTVIDFGCGEGMLSNLLAESRLGLKIIGIDRDEKRITQAQLVAESNAKFIHVDIEDFEFKSAQAVVINDVLHHHDDNTQYEIIEIANRILDKNGILILKEVDGIDWLDRFWTKFWDNKLYPSDTLNFHSTDEWESILAGLGFALIKTHRVFHPWPASRTILVFRRLDSSVKRDVFEKEQQFHDDWADQINVDNVMVNEFFEAATSPENRQIWQELGDVRGKKILELGAGAGEASVYFAKHGAIVTATDISSGMLEVVDKLARKHGCTVSIVQAFSDTLPFDDSIFDIVYAANLLHHVDIGATIREAKRVLRPGGVLASWDPLAHNPAINIYRRLAMGVRTEDEHPLRISDLKIFQREFSSVKVFTTWFFSLWIFFRFYFIDRINPNRERYWKKILTDHKRLEKSYLFLERIDSKILKYLPFLRRYCWNIVVIAKK